MFSWRVAVRFLKSNRIQTLIIILGLSIGISVQVFVGSLITGLQKSLVDRTIGSSSHITIQTASRSIYIDDVDLIEAVISENFSDITIVLPVLDVQAMGQKGNLAEPMLIRGLDFEKANQIYDFEDKLTADSRMPEADYEVIVGIGLRDLLALELGDVLPLSAPGMSANEIIVVGFFDFNILNINQAWVVTTLQTTQLLANTGDVVSSIEMQTNRIFSADARGEEILVLLDNPDLVAESWMEVNTFLLSALNGQSISSIFIQVFILISLILSIASILAISVMQKNKQISILKAMGLTDRQAGMIFIIKGFILGLVGSIIGSSLGIGLLYAFNIFAIDVNGDPIIPVTIDPIFIATSILIAITVSMLAALIPSYRSSKMSVVEVIRNG